MNKIALIITIALITISNNIKSMKRLRDYNTSNSRQLVKRQAVIEQEVFLPTGILYNQFINWLQIGNDTIQKKEKVIGTMISLNKSWHHAITFPKNTIAFLDSWLPITKDILHRSIVLDTMNLPFLKRYMSTSIYLHKNIHRLSVNEIADLIEHGADVNFYSRREKYRPILLSALFTKKAEAYEKIDFLLKNGAQLDIIKPDRRPLLLAIKAKDMKMVNILLAYNSGPTYLETAVNLEFKEAIDAILKSKKASQSELDQSLCIAVRHRNKDLAILLIKKGAHQDILIEHNRPLVLSIKRKNIEMVRLLLSYNPGTTHLETAVKLQYQEAIEAILESGKASQSELDQSLYIAAQQGNEQCMALLLQAGATTKAFPN